MPAEMRYWTCTERSRAVAMVRERIPYKEIARRLGRPYKGVKSFLGRLAKNGESPARYIHLQDTDLSRCHPVIRRIFEAAAKDGFTFDLLEKRSGVSRSALREMIRTGNTRFKNILAIAQAVNVRITASHCQGAA